MKFGIAGPISKDRVVLPDGHTQVKYGAVLYGAVALAKLLEGTPDTVVCLSHIAPADDGEVRQALRHPNIQLAGLDNSERRGTEIELQYSRQHTRTSRQLAVMTPFSARDAVFVQDCDYLLLMPLNETDIPLAFVEELCKSTSAVIFLDIHGLITGVEADGKRYQKHWRHMADWLPYLDILKMNAQEAVWACGHSLDDTADYVAYAAEILRAGVSCCWITFGDRSSLAAWRRDNRFYWTNVPVADIAPVVDTIGCGDTASAGFVYSYARRNDAVLAAILGNALGSVKASMFHTDQFPTRPEVRGIIYRHYRDYLHALLDEFLSQNELIIQEIKEETPGEDSLHISDGDRYGLGADDAHRRHSQGSSASWS